MKVMMMGIEWAQTTAINALHGHFLLVACSRHLSDDTKALALGFSCSKPDELNWEIQQWPMAMAMATP